MFFIALRFLAPLHALPGMFDRTITAAQMFSALAGRITGRRALHGNGKRIIVP
jgi:hypothetical protein